MSSTGSGLVQTLDVLDCLEENNASPACLVRNRPPQAHLDQQLNILDYFQKARSPFVQFVLLAPASRVARVTRGGQHWLILGVCLHDPCQQRIVVEARDIE